MVKPLYLQSAELLIVSGNLEVQTGKIQPKLAKSAFVVEDNRYFMVSQKVPLHRISQKAGHSSCGVVKRINHSFGFKQTTEL